MPVSATAKTASVPRLKLLLLGLAAVLVLAVAWLSLPDARRGQIMQVDGQRLQLDIARTQTAHEKGLSGRTSMPQDHGMLFVFARNQAGCFWMKDMRFNLDIVWIDDSKRVVQVAPNLSPASYPQTFCPTQPATYVVELNGGQAARLGIAPGQTLSF